MLWEKVVGTGPLLCWWNSCQGLIFLPSLSFSSKGGDLPSIDETGQLPLLLLQWVKTDQALLMLFSNGTFQVSNGVELCLAF